MRDVVSNGDAVIVVGDDRTLTYRPRRITIDDGFWLAHESRGGTLASVWATDLGDRFVEVVHLGTGPAGGELVLVVPDADVVAVGDLYVTPDPEAATAEWAAAVDLALGLTGARTTILASSGAVGRDELEAFHQRLLGLLHG